MADDKEKKTTGQEEAPEAAPAGAKAGGAAENGALMEKLASIEQLLAAQAESGKKVARSRAVMSVLMLCLVAVFAVGLFALNRTVSSATEELPALLATAEQTLIQAEGALQSIGDLDIAALNGTIEEMGAGLGAVDFEALNKSIVDLQKVTEGLANFTSIFR